VPNPLASDLDHILTHTAGVWDGLRGARLFLTGGTGFFGCWLLESFAWACDRHGLDASATVLTRSPESFSKKVPYLAAHPAIHLIRGDVRSFVFPEGRFSHIIHGATEANGALNPVNSQVMLDTILEGTRRTLDFATTAGAQRFLLLSSGAVYGAQPRDCRRLPETYRGGPDTTDPRSAYAEGKRLAELLCTLYSSNYQLDCLIARCFAFVGPYLPLDGHFAVGNFMHDCLNELPIKIRGDGTPYRSYLYAADLAIWLWTILLYGRPGRPYNVGSERDLTVAELAATVTSVLGSPHSVRILAESHSDALPERYVPETERARSELGLVERVPLEDGIRRTALWCSSYSPQYNILPK